MPIWALVAFVPLALLACPLSMWVMSKVMRRKVSCGMCSFGTEDNGDNTLAHLEARKAVVERDITQAKAEIEQNGNIRRVTAKVE